MAALSFDDIVEPSQPQPRPASEPARTTSGAVSPTQVPPTRTTTQAAVTQPPSGSMGMSFEDIIEGPKKVEEAPKVRFEELYTNQEYMKTIRDYAEARFGESGKQEKNETDEEYAKRWMRAMRLTSWNTTLNAVPELNWIYNAKSEDVEKASKAHQLFDNVLSWYQTGGQKGVRPFAEATFSAVSDPTNILSFGIGAFGRYAAARASVNAALKARIATIAGGATAESLIGASSNLVEQQIEIETGRRDKISGTEAAIAGTISAVFGGVEAGTAFRKPKQTTKEELEKVLADRRSKMPADKNTQSLIKVFDEDLDQTLNEFDAFEGRKILDDISPQTALTQAEVKRDINTRAINVAKYILLNDPTFSDTARRVATKQQKVSNAVNEVFSSIDNINENILDAAIQKEGLTLKEFADVTRTTVADAAGIMQSYSALARVLRNQVQVDPEVQEIVDKLYGRGIKLPDTLQKAKDGINRLERESKAFVVSSIATTARNVMGTSIGLTFDAAARALEGVVYQTGRVISTVARGKYEKGDLSRGLQTVVRDAFGTVTYVSNAGITAEIVDKLLVDNPRIRQQIFSALQETGTQELSRAAKIVNTFNVAQDVFFRRGIFTASVERQLRGVGMDMYELIAQGKAVPADILKNAADETLKATFSFLPKRGLMYKFVDLAESIPGGSLLVTFPRFMVNAMSFQAKYSPIGAVFGTADLAKAATYLKKDPLIAERLYRQGLEKMSKGSVGTAALVAAYNYRLENQDTEWYNMKRDDGSTVDTRAIFPIAPYLAVGDFLAKAKTNNLSGRKIDEYIQSIIGMKIPSGAQGYLIERIAAAFQNAEGKEAEKLDKSLGTVFGDFASRFIQPGQPIYAFFDQMSYEDQLARDPNVIESDAIFTESAMNRLKSRAPVEKVARTIRDAGYTPDQIAEYSKLPPEEQPAGFRALNAASAELPVAVRYLREEPPVRAGEFFNVLTGVRIVPQINQLEKEFVDVGLDPYTIFGSTGDRKFDREVIKNTQPYLKQIVYPYIQSEAYKKLTNVEKKVGLMFYVREALAAGKDIAKAEMSASDLERMNKMKFNKLPKYKRDAINQMYKRENGVTMDESKAYNEVDEYEGRILEVLSY